jgi:hypothetical protein
VTRLPISSSIGFARQENKMTTLTQIDAKSLRHGLRARTIVLPGESREEFHQLCDELEAEWQPQTRTERFYLEQMAVSQWKLVRMELGEVNIFAQDAAAQNQIPLLDRLWQAQCRMERSHARAQRELERLQAARKGQPVRPPISAAAAVQAASPDPPKAVPRLETVEDNRSHTDGSVYNPIVLKNTQSSG